MNNNFEKYLGIANHDIQMANTSQELKSYVASILYENDKKVEEIARLNNIINELEKELREGSFDVYFCSTNTQKAFKSNEIIIKSLILNKLKELKDSDK